MYTQSVEDAMRAREEEEEKKTHSDDFDFDLYKNEVISFFLIKS